MRACKALKFVVVPSSVVLTPRTLLWAMRRLSTSEIGAAVEALINELDSRSGDSDFEVDSDAESEMAA